MKKLFTTLSIFALSVISSKADILTTVKIPNWQSYHMTSKSKNHGIGVLQDGSIELFFLKRGEKLNLNKPVELKLKIERRTKNGTKWTTKSVKKDGFTNVQKAAENPEKLSLFGKITGGIEFKIDYTFTDKGVMMKAGFVGEPLDAKTADYRISVVSDVEELVTVSKDEENDIKKIKSKTRGSDLRIETRRGKPTKIRFYEPIEVETLAKDEIVSIELKADKIGRKSLVWSLANSKLGSLKIEPDADNKMPYDGFKVSTILLDETGNIQSEGILLEYK